MKQYKTKGHGTSNDDESGRGPKANGQWPMSPVPNKYPHQHTKVNQRW